MNDCFTALAWTPEGRRARGRTKTTWRRTVEKERNKAEWTEELKGGQSDCTRRGVLVTTAWTPLAHVPTGAVRLDDDDDFCF